MRFFAPPFSLPPWTSCFVSASSCLKNEPDLPNADLRAVGLSSTSAVLRSLISRSFSYGLASVGLSRETIRASDCRRLRFVLRAFFLPARSARRSSCVASSADRSSCARPRFGACTSSGAADGSADSEVGTVSSNATAETLFRFAAPTTSSGAVLGTETKCERASSLPAKRAQAASSASSRGAALPAAAPPAASCWSTYSFSYASPRPTWLFSPKAPSSSPAALALAFGFFSALCTSDASTSSS
mmetsp:Transcript_18228/g.61473  ORF Transcript_18228/g.61473 Transcript_18228/m.61473 type:complete len:244 (-) Transcript_18228:1142-1873(-)